MRVHTSAGSVDGVTTARVRSWKGVPYAAAPVGPLRWLPPEPHPGWTGSLDASSYGPGAIQPGSITAPLARLGDGTSEDCLRLNIWSPLPDGPPRAVMVWIHGGSFLGGSGAMYDGSGLADAGDVVVVTINYRLGVLGFADLPGVASNLGLRDCVAALAWVRDNIAAFGGDPSRVTVAGESAGSVLVSLLTVAPTARGLFRAAIMQSGSYSLCHGDRVRAEVAGRYLDRLGPSFASVPAGDLLAAQVEVNEASHATTAAAPWFDGDVVPASLAAAQAASSPVALLAGHTRDEVGLFQVLRADILPLTRTAVSSRLTEALGRDRSAAIVGAYPDTRVGNRTLASDLDFSQPTVHLAARHAAAGGRAFVYRFDAGVPVLGATHSAELSYLWDWHDLGAFALRGVNTRARRALAHRLRRHWTDFVRTLDPGWPDHDPDTRTTRVFRPAADRLETNPFPDRWAAWAGDDVLPCA